MKLLFTVLSFSALIFLAATGCKKEDDLYYISTPELFTDSIPFENNDIKIEFAAELPSEVTDLHFFDALKGIAITNAGEIYKTTDGGIKWTLKYASADSMYLQQVLFTDNTTGYVVGGNISCSNTGCISTGGIIIKTTDEGNTWNEVFNEPATDFVSIAVNNRNELFAAGNGANNQIFKSSDNGNSWSSVTVSGQNFNKIIFNEGSGFCTSISGDKLLISRDDGTTWNLDSAFFTPFTIDIKFQNSSGFCIGALGVYKTTNNGNTWRETIVGIGPSHINALTQSNCIAFGSGKTPPFYGAIWQTKNNGKSWTNVQFTNVIGFRCSDFYSPLNGYAVARDKLLKITVK